jgi:uncharacterized protein YcsI (UPF0317 family)
MIHMHKTGASLREAARKNLFREPTAGQAPGYIQANLAILPADWAFDFFLFAQRNPKPCPLLEVGDPGDPYTRFLADQADIRTDLPKYCVYRNGKLVEERDDIKDLWRKDFVFFLLGCSFTFETAMLQSNLTVRHIEENANVPMYRTNILCHGAGKFPASPMVVSMRPFPPADAIKAIEITREFPGVHGSPIHIGDPRQIGIENLDSPDWGDRVTIKPGEIPVFWACGVTPQMAAITAAPPLMISHAAGHMFVGDRFDHEYKI